MRNWFRKLTGGRGPNFNRGGGGKFDFKVGRGFGVGPGERGRGRGYRFSFSNWNRNQTRNQSRLLAITLSHHSSPISAYPTVIYIRKNIGHFPYRLIAKLRRIIIRQSPFRCVWGRSDNAKNSQLLGFTEWLTVMTEIYRWLFEKVSD